MAGRKVTLWVETTEACQYKCRFCYNFWRSDPASTHRHMDASTYNDFLKFCHRWTAKADVSVALAGGDPTAHPSFVKQVHDLAEFAPVYIITHGGTLDAGSLASFRNLPYPVCIQISIPTLNPSRYQYITGGNLLRPALKSIFLCRELGLPITLSVVVTRHNLLDTVELVDLAAEVKANHIILNRFLDEGRGALYRDDFSVDEESFEASVNSAGQRAQEIGVRILASRSPDLMREQKRKDTKFTVGVDGKVRFCSLTEEQAGNLDTPPESLLSDYDTFWRSDRQLPNCICSKTAASASKMSGANEEQRSKSVAETINIANGIASGANY